MKHRPQNRAEADAIAAIVQDQLERILNNCGMGGSAVSLSAKLGTFAKHLSLWGQTTNLTAAPTDPDEIVFHLMDSLAPVWIVRAHQPDSILSSVLVDGCRLLDIGSGAGFPGLILAAATGVETILIESRRKRANFLDTTAAAMGLSNVTVVNARGTSLGMSGRFDLITMRAVGITPEFFELAAVVLKPGGVALAYITVGQEFDREAASASGLVELLAPHYDMSRGGEKISRALALWLKES